MNTRYLTNRKSKKVISLLLVFWLAAMFFFSMTGQAAYASGNGTTPPITDPAAQAQSLGFDTSQEQRTDANGNPVDTSRNPLGTNLSYINRTSQLGLIYNRPKTTDIKIAGSAIYNLPMASDGLNLNSSEILLNMNNLDHSTNAKQNETDAPKATVAADFGGITAEPGQADKGSTQAFVTASIPQHSDDKNYVLLRIFINDYNQGKPVNYSFTAAILKKPAGYDKYSLSNKDYPIHMAAGDFNHDGQDEIAVAVGNYLCTIKINKIVDANTGTVSYSWDKKNSFFNETLIPYISGSDDARNEIDVSAGDADSDGFKDLLICSGDTVIKTKVNKKDVPDPNPAVLYIYSGTMDLNKPSAKIALQPQSGNQKDPGKYIFTSASVDVGDALNIGENVIIIGGRLNDESLAITYLKFDGKGYGDMSRVDYPVYTISDKSIKRMQSWLPGIKCAALDGQSKAKYVVFGNILLQYDGGSFEKQDVSHPAAKNYKNTKMSYQKANHYSQDITDIYADGEDNSYIISTIVGNFDGNIDGREQIIILHYNQFYDMNHVFLTWCGRESKEAADITTHLTKIWDEPGGIIKDQTSTNYPSIAAVDVLNTGITIVAKPELTTFTFSDPSVIAVLAAAPYYKELGSYSDAYSSSIGNVGTTYGIGKEKSSSSSNGISASVGVTYGYTHGINWCGVKLFEVEFEASLTNSFTSTWTSSKSISTSQTFTNLLADDQVVVMIVPYDVFYYDVYTKDSPEPEVIQVMVPYAPVMQNMSLSYYNKVTQNMPSAPKVTPEVLNNHAVGDPRTYTLKKGQDPNTLSNVTYSMGLSLPEMRKKTLFYNGNYNSSLIGAGISEGLSSQEITTTSTQEKSFDYALDVNVSLNITVMNKKAGVSAGVGYSHGSSASESNSISSSGTVASVPVEYPQYNYKWCLAVYNYNLATNDGKNTSECHVINYLTAPIGSFPPAQPQNLTLKDKSLTQNSAVITWDNVTDAVAYYIYRSESRDGTYKKAGDVKGNVNTSYAITGLVSGEQAYFKVSAVSDSKEGIPSDPIPIQPVEARSISISKQPKLVYTEGDKLDLSGLAISILYNDNSLADVPYGKFPDKSLTADMQNNMVLGAVNTGYRIEITYSSGHKTLTTKTNGITVATVDSIGIAKQPQFLYTEGDKLDLSGLVAVLKFSDGRSIEIGYQDFSKNNLGTDLSNQELLHTYHTGNRITVTYNNGYRNLSAQTREMSVFVQGSGDLVSNVVFSYSKYSEADLLPVQVTENGTVKVLPPVISWDKLSRATELKPGATLYAYVSIKNNLTVSQEVLVILALYDENGSMTGMSYLGQKINAGATKIYRLNIESPSGVNPYKAKVFVWDGLDLATTKQIPKANVVQIP